MNNIKKTFKKTYTPRIGIFIFVVIIIVFMFAISRLSNSTIRRQETLLRNAIERDVVQCYALEGFYPPSLTYLKEHYGLTYNESLFIVNYQPIASNMYPDFTIIDKGAVADEKKN